MQNLVTEANRVAPIINQGNRATFILATKSHVSKTILDRITEPIYFLLFIFCLPKKRTKKGHLSEGALLFAILQLVKCCFSNPWPIG